LYVKTKGANGTGTHLQRWRRCSIFGDRPPSPPTNPATTKNQNPYIYRDTFVLSCQWCAEVNDGVQEVITLSKRANITRQSPSEQDKIVVQESKYHKTKFKW